MSDETRLQASLLALRLTVFLVLAMWTVDKFVNPDHAAGVYENFYFIPGLGAGTIMLIGALEAIVVIGFVAGFMKQITYGLVFLMHAVSTLATFPQYLVPFEGPNLLFFAAWPMLAACLTLYLLRDRDRLLAVS